jgi:hypothetical protein
MYESTSLSLVPLDVSVIFNGEVGTTSMDLFLLNKRTV